MGGFLYFKFGFVGEFGLAEDAPNESLHLSVTKELWGGGGIGAVLIWNLRFIRHRWRKGCLICTRTIWRLRLNYHSTIHEIIKFGSRADVATLPPPRFRYLSSFLWLRGGPPPLHSKSWEGEAQCLIFRLLNLNFNLPDKLIFERLRGF